MKPDKRQVNHALASGLLITQARQIQPGIFICFVTDLTETVRVVFDLDQRSFVGKLPFAVSKQDGIITAERIRAVFGIRYEPKPGEVVEMTIEQAIELSLSRSAGKVK